jgi:lipoate---protein ligase
MSLGARSLGASSLGASRSARQFWRLHPFSHGTGHDHMATDEAIFQAVVAGESLPTLRFYTWERPTISLGYHQRQIPPHWETLQWADHPIDRVRRPTGGRAVLHQGDLTYAVIAPGFDGNRSVAYGQICEFLIQGWKSLGVELTYGSAGRGYIQNLNCFATATGADLVLPNGSKFIGSAQKRSGDVILQHGSMCLNPDRNLWHQVFQTESPDISENICQENIHHIINALTKSATEVFGIRWQT